MSTPFFTTVSTLQMISFSKNNEAVLHIIELFPLILFAVFFLFTHGLYLTSKVTLISILRMRLFAIGKSKSI
jgi:hypothetical protein